MLLWSYVVVGLLASATTRPAAAITYPEPSQLPPITELPDPFRFLDGTRVSNPSAWPDRRAELAEYLRYYEYGHLPQDSTSVTGTRNGTLYR